MIVVDVETVAIDDAANLVEQITSAPANYKNEDAINRYLTEANAKQIARAALYPYTARIIALGWCREGDEIATVSVANGDGFEREMLREFLTHAVDSRTGAVEPLVTFNGRAFDLPVLMVRARLLGVPCPALNVDRFRSPHPDILKMLTFDGALDPRSLTWFAKRFGLNVDDAFSGKEVAQLYEDQNWDAIRSHCASDVLLTRQLAERLGLMRPLVRAS